MQKKKMESPYPIDAESSRGLFSVFILFGVLSLQSPGETQPLMQFSLVEPQKIPCRDLIHANILAPPNVLSPSSDGLLLRWYCWAGNCANRSPIRQELSKLNPGLEKTLNTLTWCHPLVALVTGCPSVSWKTEPQSPDCSVALMAYIYMVPHPCG